jgi:hypothetical protein
VYPRFGRFAFAIKEADSPFSTVRSLHGKVDESAERQIVLTTGI